MYLAFVYNVRHNYPDPDDPKTFLETDFDDPETIESFIKHFKNLGYEVLPIEADLDAEEKLKKHKKDIFLVFNYSEVVFGSIPRIYMSKIYEKLGIPFTGCSDETQNLIIDKSKLKAFLLKNNVSTLPFERLEKVDDIEKSNLPFPLILKPVAQGSSAGITNKSVVNTKDEYEIQVRFLLQTFKEPVLAEPYLLGREFSIGLLGNPPTLLPIIEPKHDMLPKNMLPIDSLEVKWIIEEEVGEEYFSCPAKIDLNLQNIINELVLKAWNVLDIRDFCRIDVRMDLNGNIYILDVNSPPGVAPPDITETSYVPLAAKVAGIDYESLLQKIINSALERYGILI